MYSLLQSCLGVIHSLKAIFWPSKLSHRQENYVKGVDEQTTLTSITLFPMHLKTKQNTKP